MAKQPRHLRDRLAIALLRLYPPAWRRRYQAEQTALIAEGRPEWSKVADVGRGALRERFDPATNPVIDGQPVWRRLGSLMLTVGLSCALACLTTVVISLTNWLVGNAGSEIFFHEGLRLSSTQEAFFMFPKGGLLLALTLSPAVFFAYSLVFTAPVAMGLAVVGPAFGRWWPVVARLVWLFSFLWFDVWLVGFQIGHTTSLAIGGWVLACRLFPRPVAQPPPAITVAVS